MCILAQKTYNLKLRNLTLPTMMANKIDVLKGELNSMLAEP